MTISRREWLKRTAAGIGGVASTSLTVPGCATDDPIPGPTLPAAVFLHGVASGDPLADRVILWTRVTSPDGGAVEVSYTVALDKAFTTIVAEGSGMATSERDHTFKVDVDGLEAGTTYWYRFEALGEFSYTGRTRTAPTGGVDRLRFAVVSCSSWGHGYFHAYRHLAERADLDCVLHLGDYIYEYGDNQYPRTRQARPYEPSHEIVTLADYRMRYRQYRTDADLQAVHQQHPFIAIWDDHESANDSWSDGAENHDTATEGDWAERKAAAYQAYIEYLPIREQEEGKIWREFEFGDLAHLLMLDTRLWGRDEQPTDQADLETINDPTRTLLGTDQEAWLSERLDASAAKWRVLGQQVMVAQWDLGFLTNVDQWDGYAAARDRLFDELEAHPNTVVLTGDIHTHWAWTLSRDPNDPGFDKDTGAGAVGVEFVCTAISSPGLGLPVPVEDLQEQFPHLHHANLELRGYILLDVTAEAVQGDYYVIDDVIRPCDGQEAIFESAWKVMDGTRHLVEGTEAPERADMQESAELPPRTNVEEAIAASDACMETMEV